VRNLSEHLQANLQVSKKQNDQVYHDIVPVQETLETTPGELVWWLSILTFRFHSRF